MAPTDHYGIALAEVSSLPKCVTTKAREYACQQCVGTMQVRAAKYTKRTLLLKITKNDR